MVIDSHAHVNLHHYNDDRDEVIKRAFESGVEKIIIPGVDFDTINSAIELTGKYPGKIFAGVGFHPTDAIKWNDDTYVELMNLAKNPNVVAIGEVGLDYYWDTTPKEKQHEVFRLQIELAKEMVLPLIIHTRDSHDDIIRMMEENHAEEAGGVFHCFSGDPEFSKKCLALDFYLSFAGNITFKNAQNLRDVAKETPLDRILIETDSPYLTPMPHRGKRNEPSYVNFVAKQIAEVKGISVEEVSKATTENAKELFKI